jgi:hypothetical protein
MFQKLAGLLPSNVPSIKLMSNGHHDQQQAVPEVRQTHNQPRDVYEVLSLQ